MIEDITRTRRLSSETSHVRRPWLRCEGVPALGPYQSISGKRDGLKREQPDFSHPIAFHEGPLGRFTPCRGGRALATLWRSASNVHRGRLGDVWPLKMMAVEVGVGPGGSLRSAKPRLLFESEHELNPPGLANYDVSMDGERFVMLRTPTPTEIRLVLNWFEELKQLVPTEN